MINHTGRPAATLRARTGLFIVYCLAVAATSVGALWDLVELSRHDMTASHAVLILPIAVALLYESRRSIFPSVQWNWRAGAPAVLSGVGFLLATASYAHGRHPDSLTVSIAAVVALWLAGFLLFYGWTATRAALFPLLFLGFMIPIPTALLTAVTSVLKSASADTVAALFTLAGTPYLREGFVFTLPTVAIEIADECSGIRSTIALLLTSLLVGHFFLGRTWQKWVLVAAIVPITIFKNAVRIVSLCLLAIHYNPGFLAGRLHHEGGIVFYLLGLALLIPLLGLLHRWDTVRLWRS